MFDVKLDSFDRVIHVHDTRAKLTGMIWPHVCSGGT